MPSVASRLRSMEQFRLPAGKAAWGRMTTRDLGRPRSRRLLGRFGEIAAGLVLLLIGVLAFTVFQLQGSDPGDDRLQAGARVGVTLAGEIAFARDRDGDGPG